VPPPSKSSSVSTGAFVTRLTYPYKVNKWLAIRELAYKSIL
jgi:hypothetical protein